LQAAPPLLASAVVTMLPTPAAKFNVSEPLITPTRNAPARMSNNTSSDNGTAETSKSDTDPHALTFSLITKIERPILQKNSASLLRLSYQRKKILTGIPLPHTIHVADIC